MSKFHSIKKTIDGITFASTKEADYYSMLKLRKRAGEILDFELQPRFDYRITYSVAGKMFSQPAFYKADFKELWPTGEQKIIDVKGVRTNEYKRKKKIVETLYGINIIEK